MHLTNQKIYVQYGNVLKFITNSSRTMKSQVLGCLQAAFLRKVQINSSTKSPSTGDSFLVPKQQRLHTVLAQPCKQSQSIAFYSESLHFYYLLVTVGAEENSTEFLHFPSFLLFFYLLMNLSTVNMARVPPTEFWLLVLNRNTRATCQQKHENRKPWISIA